MTVNELVTGLYLSLDAIALPILAVAVLIPLAGTVLAWIGKQGDTEADGRLVANLFVDFSFAMILAEVFAIAFVLGFMEVGLLEANVVLLLAPPVCLAGSLFGIGKVFPVNQLASFRSFTDIAVFLLACAVVLWLFSKFRGWGIIFFGGIPQLLIIGVFAYVVLKRLYARAFGRHSGTGSQ
ncbi:MAG: hypothetical protein QF893_02045 [Alphaproteobacteria bacterium]|jgi:hypothetical protein|nr:hypothetical protein [Alphaproteobacteria bacterium]